MRPRLCLLVLLLVGAAPESGAEPNTSLERARQHLDALAYRQAFEELERALQAPDNPREALLEILEMRGITAAALEELDVAGASFRMLVSLNPEHRLPREYSPRIRDLFDRTKEWVAERGALRFEPLEDTKDGRARVRLANDHLRLARRVRFHFGGPNRTELQLGGELREDVSEVEFPRSAERGWWAELLGENDAVLARAGSPTNLLPLPSAPALALPFQLENPLADPHTRSHRLAAFGLWGGAGAALITGTVFGIRSAGARGQIENAQRDSTGRIIGLTQSQAWALDQQGQREAVIANILFGATAGLALAGGGVWWWNERVSLAPAPGGVAVGGTLP